MDKSIVFIAGRRPSSNTIYNSLKDNFLIKKVIIEEPEPLVRSFKRKTKRLGWGRVIGQAFFLLLVVPLLRMLSRRRIQAIKEGYCLDDTPIDEDRIISVTSVNSAEASSVFRKLNPDIVLVNGTGIVSSEILNCIPAKFINMHAGITPLYRGIYGAYWALVESNRKACGVTIHLVDSGIDTGGILEQGVIKPTDKDNVTTYPLLQLAVGIPLLQKAIADVMANRIEVKPAPEGKSRLWSHPTVYEYIRNRIRYGIK